MHLLIDEENFRVISKLECNGNKTNEKIIVGIVGNKEKKRIMDEWKKKHKMGYVKKHK